MRDKIKSIIAQSLGIEITDIDETSLLREDLGLDASELTEIVEAIKTQLSVEIEEDEMAEVRTVGDFIEWIGQYTSLGDDLEI